MTPASAARGRGSRPPDRAVRRRADGASRSAADARRRCRSFPPSRMAEAGLHPTLRCRRRAGCRRRRNRSRRACAKRDGSSCGAECGRGRRSAGRGAWVGGSQVAESLRSPGRGSSRAQLKVARGRQGRRSRDASQNPGRWIVFCVQHGRAIRKHGGNEVFDPRRRPRLRLVADADSGETPISPSPSLACSLSGAVSDWRGSWRHAGRA